MENKHETEGFSYTYSAKEQEELKRIREKYAAGEEDKMTRLRRLDAGVTNKATTVALIFGVVGCLLMGLGMSLAMSDLGQALALSSTLAMGLGVGLGLVGMLLVALALPLYRLVLKKQREKIAPEILKLTDELLKR